MPSFTSYSQNPSMLPPSPAYKPTAEHTSEGIFPDKKKECSVCETNIWMFLPPVLLPRTLHHLIALLMHVHVRCPNAICASSRNDSYICRSNKVAIHKSTQHFITLLFIVHLRKRMRSLTPWWNNHILILVLKLLPNIHIVTSQKPSIAFASLAPWVLWLGQRST